MINKYYRRRRIYIPTFRWTFDIVVTKKVGTYAHEAGGSGEHRDDTTTAMCLFYPDDMKCAVIVPPDASAGTVAHESWHAVRHMLLYVGCTLDSELVAYHLGYLVGHVTKFLKERKK